MKLSDFDYYLPEELIAQHPCAKRDESRLLVLHKNTGEIEHRHFYDLIEYLHPGDVLVRNNSRSSRLGCMESKRIREPGSRY